MVQQLKSAGLWASAVQPFKLPVDAHLLAGELTQKTGDKCMDVVAMETPAENDLTENVIRG